MKRTCFILVLPCAIFLFASCGKSPRVSAGDFPKIDGNAVLEHTRILSSDEYEGRAPGTKGESLTISYITDQFKKIGLRPGMPDGSYVQRVPLVGITPDPRVNLTFKKGGREQVLRFKDDFVAWTKRVAEEVKVENSDLVFVGYGVQAPEFNWDDYKGIDLKGKTMLVLVGDPPVPDPSDPEKLDPAVFGGRSMTYYGRWTYKYEMGAKMGAAGVLIVHETEPAGYPFSVVQGKVTEQFDLVAPDNNAGRSAIEGWISLEQAKALLAMAGKDFDEVKKSAVSRDFKPVPLGIEAFVTLRNRIRRIESNNVAAVLPGGDPTLRDQYVIYTSHWDHFGIGPEVNGDRIYHGAVDNATGIGGLIEIARAYTVLPRPPKRSVLFLAVTAEEQGLLGSTYYALNPIYPLARTLAVINMDALNVYGRTKDLTITGLGNSDLDDYATQVAAKQGRTVKPDPTPEKGSYYRSDHFPFAMQGVPALASGGGIDYVDRPADFGRMKREAYIAHDYHQPSDVIKADWDVSGMVQDAQYYFLVGYRVSQAEKFPEWKSGSEFKSRRDSMMKASGN